MSNYIEINGKNIKLKDNITEDRLIELGIVENNPFDVRLDDKAYYIDQEFNVEYSHCWEEDEIKNMYPCKDKRLVEERTKEEKLNRLLWKFAHENNAVPTEEEMRDRDFYKYYIAKYENIFKYQVYLSCFAFGLGVQLFNSKEICQRAIDEVVIPFMNGEID